VTLDRYALYEATVQSPRADVAFIDGVFTRRRGRRARTFREDFCGSAALAAAWVKSAKDRVATAIDRDSRALANAERRHRRALATERDRARLRLLHQSVLEPVRGRSDVAAAYNFSYFVFKTRRELDAYFSAVHRGLAPDGLFFLDVFGGITAEQPSLETHARGGVTYIWEQACYDPLTSSLEAYIHFRLPGGRLLRRAFRYDWRLWRIIEIREALEAAGFRRSDVYWEDRDDEGEPTGRFRRRTNVESEPSFTAYLVAER
jgi:SAM-dependent methyltransferase